MYNVSAQNELEKIMSCKYWQALGQVTRVLLRLKILRKVLFEVSKVIVLKFKVDRQLLFMIFTWHFKFLFSLTMRICSFTSLPSLLKYVVYTCKESYIVRNAYIILAYKWVVDIFWWLKNLDHPLPERHSIEFAADYLQFQ